MGKQANTRHAACLVTCQGSCVRFLGRKASSDGLCSCDAGLYHIAALQGLGCVGVGGRGGLHTNSRVRPDARHRACWRGFGAKGAWGGNAGSRLGIDLCCVQRQRA